MPNQKIRSNPLNAHYSLNKNTVVGRKNRQLRFGKGIAPKPGKPPSIALSPYVGSRITPQTRNKYKEVQIEYFVQRHIAEVSAGREKIEKQTDKTPEEIEIEVQAYNLEQMDEVQLAELAVRFATYQANKESKHYRAWLRGDRSYTYQGQNFPVITEAFINRTKEIKEIQEVKQEIDVSTI